MCVCRQSNASILLITTMANGFVVTCLLWMASGRVHAS